MVTVLAVVTVHHGYLLVLFATARFSLKHTTEKGSATGL